MKCWNVVIHIPNLLISNSVNKFVLKIIPINKEKILQIKLGRKNKQKKPKWTFLYRWGE